MNHLTDVLKLKKILIRRLLHAADPDLISSTPHGLILEYRMRSPGNSRKKIKSTKQKIKLFSYFGHGTR